MWGTGDYTDYAWDVHAWDDECHHLMANAEKGIDLTAFTYLYTEFRAEHLLDDFDKAMGTLLRRASAPKLHRLVLVTTCHMSVAFQLSVPLLGQANKGRILL